MHLPYRNWIQYILGKKKKKKTRDKNTHQVVCERYKLNEAYSFISNISWIVLHLLKTIMHWNDSFQNLWSKLCLWKILFGGPCSPTILHLIHLSQQDFVTPYPSAKQKGRLRARCVLGLGLNYNLSSSVAETIQQHTPKLVVPINLTQKHEKIGSRFRNADVTRSNDCYDKCIINDLEWFKQSVEQ